MTVFSGIVFPAPQVAKMSVTNFKNKCHKIRFVQPTTKLGAAFARTRHKNWQCIRYACGFWKTDILRKKNYTFCFIIFQNNHSGKFFGRWRTFCSLSEFVTTNIRAKKATQLLLYEVKHFLLCFASETDRYLLQYN